jgi:hypothetical protein
VLWIDLTQSRDGLRAVVNAVLKRRVPSNAGITYLAEMLLPSEKGPC